MDTTSYPLTTPKEAAVYANVLFKNNAAIIRSVSSIAGKLMTIPSVTTDELMTAWCYKRLDMCPTAEDQDEFMKTAAVTFPPMVVVTLSMLRVSPGAKQDEINTRFEKSSGSAKLIRVVETIVGLEGLLREVTCGSVGRARQAVIMLEYANFVYKSADKHVLPSLLNEMRYLMALLDQAVNVVAATTELFETRVNPPDMVSIRIVAVCNELGTVATVTLGKTATIDKARSVINDIKAQIKGDLHSETILYATIPAPKQVQIKGVPLPEQIVSEQVDITPPVAAPAS